MPAASANECVRLPDDTPFAFWDDRTEYTHTYHVSSEHTAATDDGPGTKEAPFKTIQRAADVVKPGERVLVHEGVYREHVRPRIGGTGSDRMVMFEATPGEQVVVKGSESYAGPWERTTVWKDEWINQKSDIKPNTDDAPNYHVKLPREWSVGYLPFGMINMPQHHLDSHDAVINFPAEHRFKLLIKRGLVFQDGRRLKQVHRYFDLGLCDGTYWCEANGLNVHIRPFGDADPAKSTWEFTTREQAFAPEAFHLSYIRVKGIAFEHCADGFTWPQRAAVSAMHGTHWIIEDCSVRQANANGMDLGRQHPTYQDHRNHGHHIIRRNTVSECGLCGISATARPLHNMLVEDNLLADNGWHDFERLWESAAIKMHWAKDCLYRRNLIKGTIGASGIWLDFGIKNCRITQNAILGVKSIFGGVFIEAAKIGTTMIDNNVILGTKASRPAEAAEGDETVTGGHGIYQHDSDRLLIAHNLIADCDGAACHLRLGQVDRVAEGHGATCRDHRVVNNAIVNCGLGVEFGRPNNHADGNLYANLSEESCFRIHEPKEYLDLATWREFHGHDRSGMEAEAEVNWDAEALKASLRAKDVSRVAAVVESMCDYGSAVREPGEVFPGPFTRLDPDGVRMSLDPRRTASGD